MNPIGIIRKIDKAGRFLIPKNIIKKFNINCGNYFEIFTDNEGNIILKKIKGKEILNGK